MCSGKSAAGTRARPAGFTKDTPQHSQQAAWVPPPQKTAAKRNTWLKNQGQWSWGVGSTHHVLSFDHQVKEMSWHRDRSLGVNPGTPAASVCMGSKQWWWSHARREPPGRAAVLTPCIVTWSSGWEPSLICLPEVVSFYEPTLPSSVLMGWTLLTLPSFVRLSLELTPTWASLGVKDNSS